MEKFIVLNASDPKVYISADILLVEAGGVFPALNTKLSYADKQITLDVNPTAADIAKINDAVKAVWAQGYTEATIPVTLSAAVTTVS